MSMLLHSILACLIVGIELAVPAGAAQPVDTSDPAPKEVNLLLETVQTHAKPLSAVVSDSQGLELYRTQLSSSLGLRHTLPLIGTRPPPGVKKLSVPPPQLRGPAIRLTSELAAWQAALALRQTVAANNPQDLDAVLGTIAPRRAWLVEAAQRQSLNQAIVLGEVLNSFQTEVEITGGPPVGFSEFATHLDRTHPLLEDQNGSWLSLAKQEGEDGIRRAMRDAFSLIPEKQTPEEEYMALYFASRLRPVLAANITALSTRAESEAEHQAHEAWTELQSWREDWNRKKGLVRLCGTWAWTIHNHQNHQDHKMVLTFPHPNAPSPSTPAPSKILVLGDTVYLRWDFQRGYQEDSLLFSPKGNRLEGTFRNSNGPWGSITGKRASPCQSPAGMPTP